ncbi:MAG: hypothetical protein H7177_12745 [Rhizobacter sp.]|nr:hypothetical protein [Bacteriovorax sp.]
MIGEEIIDIHFTLNFPAKIIFDFIIQAKNMPLFNGFLLIPGIKYVDSSDSIRKVGTLDKITNTDGSSHESTTDVLEPGKRYALSLRNVQMTGFKKKLANPIVGFREDWIFSENADHSTTIDRSLVIIYKKGFFNSLFITFFVRPQMLFSLLKHHQNLLKNL